MQLAKMDIESRFSKWCNVKWQNVHIGITRIQSRILVYYSSISLNCSNYKLLLVLFQINVNKCEVHPSYFRVQQKFASRFFMLIIKTLASIVPLVDIRCSGWLCTNCVTQCELHWESKFTKVVPPLYLPIVLAAMLWPQLIRNLCKMICSYRDSTVHKVTFGLAKCGWVIFELQDLPNSWTAFSWAIGIWNAFWTATETPKMH